MRSRNPPPDHRAISTARPASAASAPVRERRGIHRLALVTACTMFVLLVFGGHVTTLQAGDTEPGWSLRFWEWFVARADLETGHFFELTHRQLGTVTGLLTGSLLVALWWREPRRAVVRLAAVAFGLVVCQGALGGWRVLVVSHEGVAETAMRLTGWTDPAQARTVAGVAHAVLGMLCFTLLSACAVVTAKSWFADALPLSAARLRFFRGAAWTVGLSLLLQILLGAVLRHAGWSTAIMVLHVFNALAVAMGVLFLVVMTFGLDVRVDSLRRPALALAILVFVQLWLGIAAYAVPSWDPGRTIHHSVAALLLAGTLALGLRSYKLLEPVPKPYRHRASAGPAIGYSELFVGPPLAASRDTVVSG